MISKIRFIVFKMIFVILLLIHQGSFFEVMADDTEDIIKKFMEKKQKTFSVELDKFKNKVGLISPSENPYSYMTKEDEAEDKACHDKCDKKSAPKTCRESCEESANERKEKRKKEISTWEPPGDLKRFLEWQANLPDWSPQKKLLIIELSSRGELETTKHKHEFDKSEKSKEKQLKECLEREKANDIIEFVKKHINILKRVGEKEMRITELEHYADGSISEQHQRAIKEHFEYFNKRMEELKDKVRLFHDIPVHQAEYEIRMFENCRNGSGPCLDRKGKDIPYH